MVAVEKLPPHKARQEMFRKFTSGLDPRYLPPHLTTTRRIIHCIYLLMVAKLIKLIKKQKQEVGSPCLGIQLDLWKSTSSRDHYCAINLSFVPKINGALQLAQFLMSFKKFPRKRHNAENLSEFVDDELIALGIESEDIEMATPDGASNGVKALKLSSIPGRVCADHNLQRCAKYGLGTTGKPCKNPYMRDHIKSNKKMVKKTRQCDRVENALDQVQVCYATLKVSLLIRYVCCRLTMAAMRQGCSRQSDPMRPGGMVNFCRLKETTSWQCNSLQCLRQKTWRMLCNQ